MSKEVLSGRDASLTQNRGHASRVGSPSPGIFTKFGTAMRTWAETNCTVVILRDGPQNFAAGEPLRPSRSGPV